MERKRINLMEWDRLALLNAVITTQKELAHLVKISVKPEWDYSFQRQHDELERLRKLLCQAKEIDLWVLGEETADEPVV